LQSGKTFNVVHDSCASISVVNDASLFVPGTFKAFDLPKPVKGIGVASVALGVGVIDWSLLADNGAVMRVQCEAYFIPTCGKSLLRTQQLVGYYQATNNGSELAFTVTREGFWYSAGQHKVLSGKFNRNYQIPTSLAFLTPTTRETNCGHIAGQELLPAEDLEFFMADDAEEDIGEDVHPDYAEDDPDDADDMAIADALWNDFSDLVSPATISVVGDVLPPMDDPIEEETDEVFYDTLEYIDSYEWTVQIPDDWPADEPFPSNVVGDYYLRMCKDIQTAKHDTYDGSLKTALDEDKKFKMILKVRIKDVDYTYQEEELRKYCHTLSFLPMDRLVQIEPSARNILHAQKAELRNLLANSVLPEALTEDVLVDYLNGRAAWPNPQEAYPRPFDYRSIELWYWWLLATGSPQQAFDWIVRTFPREFDIPVTLKDTDKAKFAQLEALYGEEVAMEAEVKLGKDFPQEHKELSKLLVHRGCSNEECQLHNMPVSVPPEDFINDRHIQKLIRDRLALREKVDIGAIKGSSFLPIHNKNCPLRVAFENDHRKYKDFVVTHGRLCNCSHYPHMYDNDNRSIPEKQAEVDKLGRQLAIWFEKKGHPLYGREWVKVLRDLLLCVDVQATDENGMTTYVINEEKNKLNGSPFAWYQGPDYWCYHLPVGHKYYHKPFQLFFFEYSTKTDQYVPANSDPTVNRKEYTISHGNHK
jgi:hypothetical protein